MTQTKADGVVELPRKHFVDTRRPVKEVELRAWGPPANAVEFRVTTPAPGNLDATIDVPVKLSPLEITLKNQDRLNAPAPEKVFFSLIPRREESDTDSLPDAIDGTSETWMGAVGVDVFREGDEVSAKPSIHLPAVQDGTYDMFIGAAGAEVWRGMAKVGPGPSRISATLQPGSDVRFEVVTPDGSPGFGAAIFKDGKEFQVEPDREIHGGYRALPCGHYEICIRGSEWIDQYRQSQKLKRGPDEVSYAGREIFFEITEGSPAIIDFGKIHLDAIEREPN